MTRSGRRPFFLALATSLLAASCTDGGESNRTERATGTPDLERHTHARIKGAPPHPPETLALAPRKGVALPHPSDSSHKDPLDDLEWRGADESGKDCAEMTADSRPASVDRRLKVSADTDDAALGSFASRHLPTLERHWQMAQALSVDD